MGGSKLEKLTALAETKYLSLYNGEYTNKAGNLKSWIIASRKSFQTLKEQYWGGREEKVDAVLIAAIHKSSGKLVLVRQFRVPVNDYIYEIPAGLVDGNEEIPIAVKRELKEETGLDLLEINEEASKSKVYMSPGMTDESVAFVFCTCEGTVNEEYLEEDEDLECILVSREEAVELLNSQAKMDMKVFLVLKSFVQGEI